MLSQQDILLEQDFTQDIILCRKDNKLSEQDIVMCEQDINLCEQVVILFGQLKK